MVLAVIRWRESIHVRAAQGKRRAAPGAAVPVRRIGYRPRMLEAHASRLPCCLETDREGTLRMDERTLASPRCAT